LIDHQVGSEAVLPGAAYVAMAIEAVRLLTDPSETSIHRYRLRDVDITNALIIPDSLPGVKTQLCLCACSHKELDYKGWYEFEVCSVSGADGSRIQHCKGYVTTESINPTKPAILKSEMKAPSPESFFTTGCAASVDPESTFAALRQMNLYHGPSFQNLISSQAAAHKSITILAVSPAASDYDETYVLHPTTLDSIIQAFCVSIRVFVWPVSVSYQVVTQILTGVN
jgi:hypothetical protein